MNPDIGTVDIEITINPKKHQHPRVRRASAPRRPSAPGIPRITRLMALAIKFQGMVDSGEVRDYADLARLGYVSRARMTQIMNLLKLAPDIQEEILLTPGGPGDQLRVPESQLRALTHFVAWTEQRRLWQDRRGRMPVKR